VKHQYQCPKLPIILLFNLDPSWLPNEISETQSLARELETALTSIGHPTTIVCLENEALETKMADFDPDQSIVFNWCEELPGIPRSGHMVAEKLEEMGFVYTGTDSRALQFCQNKPSVKERLYLNNIPTPNWTVCENASVLDWDCFPAIVKPAYEHCSFGITHEAVVHTQQELKEQASRTTTMFRQPVLVEDFIDGREFHVTIVGNGKLQVFPIAEMDFSAISEDRGRLCTYDSKFVPGSIDYQMIQLRLPAQLSAQEKQRLEAVAIAAYRATDCRDYARLDIRIRDGTFFVLDVNPNADISPDASVALSAEQAGYSFGEFGSLLTNLAAQRHPIFGKNLPVLQPRKKTLPSIPAWSG
jgi:D-alanine-D-alanine ligase